MSRIFISYRRRDAPYAAGRIYEELESHFGSGSTFIDVDALQAGEDVQAKIQEVVGRCQIFLAVIGHGWLAAKDQKGRRRLDNPADWVRLEIEAALKRKVTVIPVLLDGVLMPQVSELPESLHPLAYRQAAFVRHGRDFRVDIARLMEVIQQRLDIIEKQTQVEAGQIRREEARDIYERETASRRRDAEDKMRQEREQVEVARKIEETRQVKLAQIRRQTEALAEKQTNKQETTVQIAEEQTVGRASTQINGAKPLSRKNVLIATSSILLLTATFSVVQHNFEQIERARQEGSSGEVDLSSPNEIVVSDAPIYVKGSVVEEAWVSILADDEVIFEGVLQPGDVQVWEAQTSLSVYTANAGGLELSENGGEFELVGERGQSEEKIFSRGE